MGRSQKHVKVRPDAIESTRLDIQDTFFKFSYKISWGQMLNLDIEPEL